MGQMQNYASNSGDFNVLFLLMIISTYLIYEIGKIIMDKNDDALSRRSSMLVKRKNI